MRGAVQKGCGVPRCAGGPPFWGRVTYTTVIEAQTRSMLSLVPLGCWGRYPQRTARGPSSCQVWLVRMAWCWEGSKSCRCFQMRVLLLVGMSVLSSIQRGHVLRARCAAWSLIVAISQISGKWLWVMWWRRSAVCLV